LGEKNREKCQKTFLPVFVLFWESIRANDAGFRIEAFRNEGLFLLQLPRGLLSGSQCLYAEGVTEAMKNEE